ncbi:MAG: CesT family type III secretion system chaperone [Planctomycetota bacterium]
MKRQQFFDAIRDDLQLGELTPDDAGVYTIVFDGDLEIELLPLSDSRVLLRAWVATLPDDQQAHEAFLRGLLNRNLGCLQSQQAALALDGETGRVWLHRPLDTQPLDDRSAVAAVGDFVNTTEWWKQAETSASPLDGLPFSMLRP